MKHIYLCLPDSLLQANNAESVCTYVCTCLGKPVSMLHRSRLKISRSVFDTDSCKAVASICAVEHSKKSREIKGSLHCFVVSAHCSFSG